MKTKKIIIALLSVLVLMTALTGCFVSNQPDSGEETTVANATVASSLAEIFKTEAVKEDATTNSIATALSENESIAFMPMVQDMEAGYLAGFDADITGFDSCTAFLPLIGTIPFVSYVFELAEDADVDAFVTSLKDNHNLRWNICTAAEEMLVETEGNFVFFVMAPYTFEVEEETEAEVEGDETTDVEETEADADVTEEVVDETVEVATEENVEETESVA